MGRGWWYKTLWETAFIWSNVVFEKEVIFHEFDFETSDLEFEVSKSSIWTHTISCDKGNFHRLVLLHVKMGLKQSNIQKT